MPHMEFSQTLLGVTLVVVVACIALRTTYDGLSQRNILLFDTTEGVLMGILFMFAVGAGLNWYYFGSKPEITTEWIGIFSGVVLFFGRFFQGFTRLHKAIGWLVGIIGYLSIAAPVFIPWALRNIPRP